MDYQESRLQACEGMRRPRKEANRRTGLKQTCKLLKAFRQSKTSLRKRSEDEEKVLRKIMSLVCIVRKMSSTGRSDKGLRWSIREQLAELCMQGWKNDDEHEPVLEE